MRRYHALRIKLICCLAAIAFSLPSLRGTAAGAGEIPDWIILRAGQEGYIFALGAGQISACETYDLYVAWLKAPTEAQKNAMCPKVRGGQRVTILQWKAVPIGPNFTAPAMEVRFPNSNTALWTLGVSPVVPQNATVSVVGPDCTTADAPDRATREDAAILTCKAIIINQTVSSTENTLTVRYVRSGRVVTAEAGHAFLPDQTYRNGYPRYDLEHFVAP